MSRGDRLVVGFSGGRDSLALAAAMRRVQAILGIEPRLVHVDHRLREDSADDASSAAELANQLGLTLRIVTVPAPPAEAHPGVGIEEAARRERYRLLFREADQVGAAAVATAHHESDQAETVLLHLLRGGGVHGAAGMAERTRIPWPESTATLPHSDISHERDRPWLWRPFLREPRAGIDAYVARLGLPPIEDPSNDDMSLRRNALRHQVLPLMEQHIPGATAALARYAALASEDDLALDDLARRVLTDAVDPGGHLSGASLLEQPLAVQRRVVRQWLVLTTGARVFTAERVEAILHLLRAERGDAAIEAGEGWIVRRAGRMLRLDRPEIDHQGGADE